MALGRLGVLAVLVDGLEDQLRGSGLGEIQELDLAGAGRERVEKHQ